jgi:hypothetical protein
MKPEHKGILLRILLNRAHGNPSDQILKGFPKAEADAVRAHAIGVTDPAPLLTHASTVLPMIHYSWIFPFIKDQDKPFQLGIISCLSPVQQRGLSKLCKVDKPLRPLSPFLKKFYIHHLYRSVPLLSEALPLEYAPESPLTKLARMTKQDLIDLIDRLAMFDLAHEMRTIVGTKHLKALYTALSVKQQEFLRRCLHAKDRMKPKKLHLQNWQGDPKALLLELHKRGIVRLAYALSGQHEDLIWHVVHGLDSGRGTLLKKLIKPEPVPAITDSLILQIQMATQGET